MKKMCPMKPGTSGNKGEKSMWETLRKEEILKRLGVDSKYGLSQEEAKRRQEKYGKNKLKDKPKEGILVRFIKQFNDFMIIILIIASIISAVVSNLQGENDYIVSIIIIAIVVLNAIMGVVAISEFDCPLTPTIGTSGI